MDVVALQPCGDDGSAADETHQGVGCAVVAEQDHEADELVEADRTSSPG